MENIFSKNINQMNSVLRKGKYFKNVTLNGEMCIHLDNMAQVGMTYIEFTRKDMSPDFIAFLLTVFSFEHVDDLPPRFGLFYTTSTIGILPFTIIDITATSRVAVKRTISEVTDTCVIEESLKR